MKKVKFKSEFRLMGTRFNPDIETEKNVEVYIDEVCKYVVPEDVIRIIILQEPFGGEMVNFVYRYRDTYTYLLTYRDELLLNNPKAVKFLGINCWMRDHEITAKKFSVSTVVGGKSGTDGYTLRHDVWREREQIKIPREFYLSSQCKFEEGDYTKELVLGDTKDPLFTSMFHISIENLSMNNMFTEKLLDCFQAKVVPIYWGCENISNYFNTNGMIIVNNLQEIIDVCNRLTPEVYKWMLPFIEDNSERAVEWYDYETQVRTVIKKLLNE